MIASPPPARWSAGRPHAPLACVPLLLLAAACGLPTGIPQVDQRWIAPAQTIVVPVTSVAPAGVHVVPDSSAFLVDLPPASVTRALSADCAACASANGMTVPKPAFVVNASVASALPPDIVSATLTGGTLQLSVQNSYNFDPLRPSATARGYAVVTVSNGSQVIGRDSVNGATTALPVGGSITRSIALAGPVSSASPVTVSVRLDSPAGDSVQMDATRFLIVSATPSNLRVPSATVNVLDRMVTASARLSLSDVDPAITAHVTGGALQLSIDNPFTVGGTIAVRLTAAGVPAITRSVALAPGATNPSIALSQSELQSLFGREVSVSISGPVTATSGPITVTPRQALVVKSRFDLTLHTGG